MSANRGFSYQRIGHRSTDTARRSGRACRRRTRPGEILPGRTIRKYRGSSRPPGIWPEQWSCTEKGRKRRAVANATTHSEHPTTWKFRPGIAGTKCNSSVSQDATSDHVQHAHANSSNDVSSAATVPSKSSSAALTKGTSTVARRERKFS